MSATELLDLYGSRRLSPVEAVEAVMERVREDPCNAYNLVSDTAVEEAKASAERWQRRRPKGMLDGVPVSIKDMLLVEGWPTRRGSRTTSEEPATEDGPHVARLREQGAIFVGKTTTPEFAWKGVTDSPLTGVTTNPWDTGRTAGGSSGGAAAAVAVGAAPMALGTDGGGSVRIPAAFCGIFALKATYGRVPHWPSSPYGTLAHCGPMTWTVDDAALLMDVISAPDGRDWSELSPPDTSFVREVGSVRDLSGIRVAVSPGLGFAEVDPDVSAAVEDAARAMESMGAKVDKTDPGFTDPVDEFAVLWNAGAAKVTAGLDLSLMDPGLQEIVADGRRYSAADYLEAMRVRMALGELMGRFHRDYDLLVSATVPIGAFEAGVESPTPGRRWTSWSPLTYPFNMTQQPAASVPWGFTTSGLPIGVQLIGPRHADAAVLRASRLLERSRPWPRPPLTA